MTIFKNKFGNLNSMENSFMSSRDVEIADPDGVRAMMMLVSWLGDMEANQSR